MRKLAFVLSRESVNEIEIAIYMREEQAKREAEIYERLAKENPEDERVQKNAEAAKRFAECLSAAVNEWKEALCKGVMLNA